MERESVGFFRVWFISSKTDAVGSRSAIPGVKENECTLQETRDLVQVAKAFHKAQS